MHLVGVPIHDELVVVEQQARGYDQPQFFLRLSSDKCRHYIDFLGIDNDIRRKRLRRRIRRRSECIPDGSSRLNDPSDRHRRAKLRRQ